MAVQFLLSCFTRCIWGLDQEPAAPKDRDFLPLELHTNILTLVGNPTLTALVNHRFLEASLLTYSDLLKQYHIEGVLFTDEMTPLEKVKKIYTIVLEDAKNCEIDPRIFSADPSPFSPSRLHQIRALTEQRWKEKASVYRAIFHLIPWNLNAGTDQEVIRIAELWMSRRGNLLTHFARRLSLKNLDLTHLPSRIGYLEKLHSLGLENNQLTTLPPILSSLTHLWTLNLRGNPLPPEEVKKCCKALPSLHTVIIDSQQPALIEMFQIDFPHLNVLVTEILVEEEPI